MALFTVFALCLTLVLLMGASSFRGVSQRAEQQYSERTPLLYLSQKIRSFDRSDGVGIENINGITTLVLTEASYDVFIYHHDGHIKELLVFHGDRIDLDIGIDVFAAQSMELERVSESLIKTTVDGKSIYVNVQSEVVT